MGNNIPLLLLYIIEYLEDLLLLLRRLVHEGTPLDTVVNAVLGDIALRSDEVDKLAESQKEWICRLLKTGIIILKFAEVLNRDNHRLLSTGSTGQ